MTSRGSRGSPQTERAVHMHPGALPVRRVANVADRVGRSGVHVAGLNAHDRRAAESGKSAGPHRSLSAGGNRDDSVAAQAEQSQSLEHGNVDLLSNYHGDRRRAKEPILFHPPAGIHQGCVAGSGQSR
jgi:hypothetical protein